MEGGAIAVFGLESTLDGEWGYSTICSGWSVGLDSTLDGGWGHSSIWTRVHLGWRVGL
jgi:hypothetical protein